MSRRIEAGQDVARLHSGDLSVWSAVAEQIRRLEKHGIPYTLTPGVPSFAAAAAALGRELTIPEVAQSLVLTRVSGRASKMPEGETLAAFGATGATLAIHLAIHAIDEIVAELSPLYGADCPVAVVFRASWPDERDHPRHAWRHRGEAGGRPDRAHGDRLRRARRWRPRIFARARSTTPIISGGFAGGRGRDDCVLRRPAPQRLRILQWGEVTLCFSGSEARAPLTCLPASSPPQRRGEEARKRPQRSDAPLSPSVTGERWLERSEAAWG